MAYNLNCTVHHEPNVWGLEKDVSHTQIWSYKKLKLYVQKQRQTRILCAAKLGARDVWQVIWCDIK